MNSFRKIVTILTIAGAAFLSRGAVAQNRNAEPKPGAVQLGSGDNRPVELIVDGVPYFRLLPGGNLETLNGATFTGNVGVGADVTYSAGIFGTNGTSTWTVASSDVVTLRYVLMGKLAFIQAQIQTTDVSAGNSTNLYVTLPSTVTASKTCINRATVTDNATEEVGRIFINAGSSVLRFNRNGYGAFSASAGATQVIGQLMCEVS